MPKVGKDQKGHKVDSRVRTKAAAWAWYEHGGGTAGQGPKSEVAVARLAATAHRRPSRFKVEAEEKTRERKRSREDGRRHSFESAGYFPKLVDESRRSDCESSLFDSFELVAMSKQLGRGLTNASPDRESARESTEATVTTTRILGSPATNRVAEGAAHPQGNRHKHTRFTLRMPGPFCNAVEVLSPVHKLDHIKNVKKHSPNWAGYAKAVDEEKQTKSSKAGEENSNCKKEKSHHRLSFQDISRALHQVSQLPHILLGDKHSHEHDHHHHHHHIKHLHHHHHHYLQFHSEEGLRLPSLDDSLIVAATALQQISLPSHVHTEKRKGSSSFYLTAS